MATVASFNGDVDVFGIITARGGIRGIARTDLAQETLKPFPVELVNVRVHDAFQTPLGSAASDDLGITAGTFGTGCPYITAGDLKAAGATTRRGRFKVMIPGNYVAGETVNLRFAAGMLTTVADGSCTIDAEAYLVGENGLVSGSDLVTTGATTINSLTFGNKDFTVDPATLNPGKWLDVRISITCTDAATATAVTPAIAAMWLLADAKG